MKRLLSPGLLHLSIGLILIFSIFSFSVASNNEASIFLPKQKLSEYGFFVGELKGLKPSSNVFRYELNSTLFSNYAEKLRFIYLPPGEQVTYKEKGVLHFPVGTFLIKNFFYPFDFRHPEKGRRIIETRLLVKTDNGWQAWPYYWNDEQTEALYDVAGETTTVSYINIQGKKVKTAYHVPNKNECKGCHSYNQELVPIGVTAAELNRDGRYIEGEKNQLLKWKEQGWLAGLPGLTSVSKMPAWDDNNSGTVNDRARAYLDVNCSHCHQKGGPAETSGLLLTYEEQNLRSIGIYKTPVATGKGSGGRLYDIVPGKPEESILLHRMQITDPGSAMPELGREQVHKEAINLIALWIKSMKNIEKK